MNSGGCVNRVLCTAAGILLLGVTAGCGNAPIPNVSQSVDE